MNEAVSVIGVPTTEAAARQDLVDAVEAAGAEARVGALGDFLAASSDPESSGVDAVVAVGGDGVRAAATRRPSVPILPVDADPGLRSVPADEADRAIEAVVAGEATTEAAPLLEVAVDDAIHTTAYRDVTLITAEPAKISEFEIARAGGGHLDTVRADGVVVATPVGSHGYAAAGEGPLLEPGTGLAVVPVAPFRTDRNRWVVPVERVTVRVQRDEAAVTVEADGEVLTTVGRGATLSLRPAATMGVLVTEQSVRGPA
ncbi:ATP-NAD/AcoX kinase [Salinarchaeum sp. Harcht-Bsk1]|uniref:NAD(+)/NADH kinase n=1 Tax=Salinarchaeum sp. Harcht-Bsk1 TaxID=1333523 RepID=UPI000342427C|nr:NAD(+)/NADH kinase [Salinarchaeum sp. Harcht-Bsk1]AGN00603.1 ATP-NAD/AcoX kinase [Salinarchaeum sp. Harcht-Bsk1]